jgi:hypothetical protein
MKKNIFLVFTVFITFLFIGCSGNKEINKAIKDYEGLIKKINNVNEQVKKNFDMAFVSEVIELSRMANDIIAKIDNSKASKSQLTKLAKLSASLNTSFMSESNPLYQDSDINMSQLMNGVMKDYTMKIIAVNSIVFPYFSGMKDVMSREDQDRLIETIAAFTPNFIRQSRKEWLDLTEAEKNRWNSNLKIYTPFTVFFSELVKYNPEDYSKIFKRYYEFGTIKCAYTYEGQLTRLLFNAFRITYFEGLLFARDHYIEKYIRNSEQRDFLERYLSKLVSIGYMIEPDSLDVYNDKTKIFSDERGDLLITWDLNNRTVTVQDK